MKFAQWFQRRRCLKMLTIHIRTTEAYLSCKLTTEPCGSGELKWAGRLGRGCKSNGNFAVIIFLEHKL